MSFERLYPSLHPGELIEGTFDPRFRNAWLMAKTSNGMIAISNAFRLSSEIANNTSVRIAHAVSTK
jgi:hypothetical protein